MNVMTVTEVVADPQTPVKTDPQGDVTQGFASELDRASNAGETGKDAKAVAAQKTTSTDQPDRQNGAKEEKDKDTDQANAALLMQGAIPVIMQAQPVQATDQPAGGNENAAVPAIPAAETIVTQVLPVVEQIVAQEDVPAGTVQIQQETTTQGKMVPMVQTATEGQAKAAEPLPKAAQQDEKAQAFAKQAMQEMETLQKAAAPAAKQAETVQEVQPQPVQANTVMQTGEQPQEQQTQAQQTQAEPDMQQADAKPLTVKADAKETAGQPKQDTAQPEPKFQKQETNNIANQTQAPVWQPVNGTAPIQFRAPQAQEPVVQQNVVTTIINRVSTAVEQGKSELTVQLKPEHLGGLEISLTMGDSGLTAKMVTSQESVQSMIHNQIGLLQDTLREKGIPVVHMEVVYDQTGNSASFSHNGNSGQWASPQGNGNSPSYKDTEDSVNYYNFMSNYDVLAEHGGSVEFSA